MVCPSFFYVMNPQDASALVTYSTPFFLEQYPQQGCPGQNDWGEALLHSGALNIYKKFTVWSGKCTCLTSKAKSTS